MPMNGLKKKSAGSKLLGRLLTIFGIVIASMAALVLLVVEWALYYFRVFG